VVILFVGVAIALFGYLRSSRPFVRTTGLIVESAPVGGMKSTIWRIVDYTYTVAGHAYTGQSVVPNSWGHSAPVEVDRELPVYFVSLDPDVSYAFDPPTAPPWIMGGLIPVLLGSVIILFTWRS
jgi:hypothetical protein